MSSDCSSPADVKPIVNLVPVLMNSSMPEARARSSPVKTAPPRKKKSSAKAGSKASAGIGISSKPKAEPGTSDGGAKKTGSWTKGEVRALWDALELLPAKRKWDDVAADVPGRDKLSCQNKWRYDLLPKLQAFIDSLGEDH